MKIPYSIVFNESGKSSSQRLVLKILYQLTLWPHISGFIHISDKKLSTRSDKFLKSKGRSLALHEKILKIMK